MLRLQVPRVRTANAWALGKFGGEFGQSTQTYAAPPYARARPPIPREWIYDDDEW
jgi:hypothetical protein